MVAALLAAPELASAGGTGTALPWNVAWGGGPIDTGEEAGIVEYVVPDGPRITLLSPTTKRLLALATTWYDTVHEATRGATDATAPPDAPAPLTDLAAIAAEKTPKDR